jgi:dihydrofolate synthase/folylpolyglutamate synthase
LINEIEPSFFEITVAMAFDYFAKQEVDIAVIEVGLGGRFDSTNIITPELSIITNIGWDHMNMLGDTLEKIAFEKAGIIKKNIPVVIGEVIAETKPVFEKIAADLSGRSFMQRKKICGWLGI